METLYDGLINHSEKLSVIGLGYVGMPLAIAFSKKNIDVVGFDINSKKIEQYLNGIDPTEEVGNEEIKNTKMKFTADENDLREAKFHIVAVPTPINLDKTPNLAPVEGASETVGRNLTKGSIVVYESTVYPGVTEEVCIPILEKTSGLKHGVDFKVGYSPERINPGDKVNTLEKIIKIVSGSDQESLDLISQVYEIVIDAGVHRASSIKVAEAAKVVENSQRDINIAFMNELALVFDRMNIDSVEVIEAMNTKWNALGFYPGLVGGHCIGVDPYYFIYQAEKLGYHSQIIASGRKINDAMGSFVADALIKQLILSGKKVVESKVAILGLTFKENTPDIRNSKVIDVIDRLKEYGINPIIADPKAEQEEVKAIYGLDLIPYGDINDVDAVVLTVGHEEYKQLTLKDIDDLFKPMNNSEKIIIDVKSLLNKQQITEHGYSYWRL